MYKTGNVFQDAKYVHLRSHKTTLNYIVLFEK